MGKTFVAITSKVKGIGNEAVYISDHLPWV